MSIRISRHVTAAALLAGCLCLPLATPAGATPSAGARRGAAASSSGFLGSFWSLLVHLWAGDDDHGGSYSGHGGSAGHDSPEGPGMCPHGGH